MTIDSTSNGHGLESESDDESDTNRSNSTDQKIDGLRKGSQSDANKPGGFYTKYEALEVLGR